MVARAKSSKAPSLIVSEEDYDFDDCYQDFHDDCHRNIERCHMDSGGSDDGDDDDDGCGPSPNNDEGLAKVASNPNMMDEMTVPGLNEPVTVGNTNEDEGSSVLLVDQSGHKKFSQ